ncbi:MAG: sulfatase-like hydrolase/transferase [Phycisphaerae bacterium]|nr:sulfatase-like hydrolase/transferase [Phycisphaerae bacterium]
MNRRKFIKQMGWTIAAGAMGINNVSGAVNLSNNMMKMRVGPKKYNVLFVLVDQWRFCAMSHGLHHDRLVKTPNLDKTAKSGAHWGRCYATHPVCTPNRSAIITGRWPWQTGMNENDLMMPPGERCLAQEFTDAGYNCYYIGKWHMDGVAKPGYVPKGWRRRGFTKFEGFNRGHEYLNTKTFDDDGNLMPGLTGLYEPTIQTDLAIKFIKENRNHPFFCFVSWGAPHTPYGAHLGDFPYNAEDVVPRPNVPADKISAAKNSLKDYFSHCSAMDYQFGRLMQTLEDLKLDDDTLVVFTADHGDMHQSHAMTYKSKPEEESWHVPLIMRLPSKIKSGTVVNHLISSADLMPTILSICGFDVPATCTGRDVSPAITNPDFADESVYGGIRDSWRAVAKGDYKLVVEVLDGETTETATKLYNVKADPYEMDNLVNNAIYATVKTDLLAEIEKWKAKTSDSFPVKPWVAEKMYPDP